MSHIHNFFYKKKKYNGNFLDQLPLLYIFYGGEC